MNGPAEVVTLGEVLGRLTPCRGGPLRPGSTLELWPVGAEANVAVGLARLGHRSRWVGALGDDEVGELALTALRGEGVDVSLARRCDRPTGMMLATERVPGRATVTYWRRASAGSTLRPEDLPEGCVDGASVVHVSGTTPALGPGPNAAVRRLVHLAGAAGAEVSIDVNHRAALWSREAARAVMLPLARAGDIVFAGEDELDIVAEGHDEGSRIADLLACGVREVVVKRGPSGATVYTDAARVDVPAVPVVAVDVVGAGDAAAAGYLSALLDGCPPAARLVRAVTVAAFAVAHHGDWVGLPRRQDLGLLDVPAGTVAR